MARILEFKITTGKTEESRTGNDKISVSITVSTDELVSPQWMRNHPLTPKINGPAEGFPGFYWDTVNQEQKFKLIWQIDCTASEFLIEPEPDSPLAAAAEIAVNSELIDEPTQFDWKGRPIMTTAGEWIAGVTRSRPLLTYVISKNLPQDPAWLETHLGAVNKDPVRLRGRICKPNTLMLRRLSLSPYTSKGKVSFTVCGFELHYDPYEWIKRIWNKGTIQLIEFKTAKGAKAYRQERIKVRDSNGVMQNVEDAVPIDKKGRVIPGVLSPEQDTPVDVSKLVVLSFEVQPVQTFGGVLPLL